MKKIIFAVAFTLALGASAYAQKEPGYQDYVVTVTGMTKLYLAAQRAGDCHFRTPAWVKSLFDIAEVAFADGGEHAAKLGMPQARINEIRDAVVNEQRQMFLFDSATAENCESFRQSGLLAKLDETRAKFLGKGVRQQ